MAIPSKTGKRKSQAGFTLVEGMIAGGLLAVTAVAVSSVMGSLQSNLVSTQVLGNRDIIMHDVVRAARSSLALNNSLPGDTSGNLSACLTGGLCNPAQTPFMLSTPFSSQDWISGSTTCATDPTHCVTFDASGRRCPATDPTDINCVFMVNTSYTAGCSNPIATGLPNAGWCPTGAEYIRVDFTITYSQPNPLGTMNVVSVTNGHALDNVANLGTDQAAGPTPSPAPNGGGQLNITQMGMQDSSGNFIAPNGTTSFNQAQIIASTPATPNTSLVLAAYEAQFDNAALVFNATGIYAYEGGWTWPISGPDSGQYGYQNPRLGYQVRAQDTCWPKYVMNTDGTFTTTLNTARLWPGDPNDGYGNPNSQTDGWSWPYNPQGAVPVPSHAPQDANDNSPGSTNNLLVELDLAPPVASQVNVTLYRYVFLPYCGFDHYSFDLNQSQTPQPDTWKDGVDQGYDDGASSSWCGLNTGFGSQNWNGWDPIANFSIPPPPSNTTVAYICEVPTMQSGRQAYAPVGVVTTGNSTVGSNYSAAVIMKRAPEVQIDFADPYTTFGSTQFPSTSSSGGVYVKACDPTFSYGASGAGGTPGFTVWDDFGLASIQGLTDANLPSVVTYSMDIHNKAYTRRDMVQIPEQPSNLTAGALTLNQGWTVSFGVTDLIGQVASPVSQSVTVPGAGTTEAIRIGTGMGSGDGSNRYNAQEVVQSSWNSGSTPTATCANTDANVLTCMPNVAVPLSSNLILEGEFRLHCGEFNGSNPDVLLDWWTYNVTQGAPLGSNNSPNKSQGYQYSQLDFNFGNDCNGQPVGQPCAINSNPCYPVPRQLMGDSPTSVYWDWSGAGMDMDYFLCYNHAQGSQLQCLDWLGEPSQCLSTPPVGVATGLNLHTGPDLAGGKGDILAATAQISVVAGVSDVVGPDTTLFKLGNILAWIGNDDVYWLWNSTITGPTNAIVNSASSKFNLKVMTSAPFNDSDVTFDLTDITGPNPLPAYQVTINAGDQQNDDSGMGTTIQSLWNPSPPPAGQVTPHNFQLSVDASDPNRNSFVIAPIQTTTYTSAVDSILQRGNFWMIYDNKNPMADICPNGTTEVDMQTSIEQGNWPPNGDPWVSDWVSNDYTVNSNMHQWSGATTAAGMDNFQSVTTAGLDTQMSSSNPLYFNPTISSSSAVYYLYMIVKKTSSTPTLCSSFPNTPIDVERQCACTIAGYGGAHPCPTDLIANGDPYQTNDLMIYLSWMDNSNNQPSGNLFDFGPMQGLRQPYLITDPTQKITAVANAIPGQFTITNFVPYGSLEVNQILLKVCEP